MKTHKLFLLLFLSVSCKNEPKKPVEQNQVQEVPTIEKGFALFQDNNCASCHQPNQKVIGPSLHEIATIYKKEKGNLVAFLKEQAKPIVDPAMYETMRINLQVTKNMTEQDLHSLELYLLNQ